MDLHFTREQSQTLKQQGDELVRIHDDDTHTVYYLVKYDAGSATVQDDQIRQAILNRRSTSSQINQEWQSVDMETWPQDTSFTT